MIPGVWLTNSTEQLYVRKLDLLGIAPFEKFNGMCQNMHVKFQCHPVI
jgi:hypothetical protein